nr:calcium-translocating P-type ATPase, PMCA-type [Leyella stercorea]
MHIVNVNNINKNMESKHHYTGLTAAQVAESRAKYGENVLTPPAKEPLWRQFLDKFRDPLIIILLIAGVLSIVISCYEYFGMDDGMTVFFEPVGIFVAIMLATGLAFYFEYQADKEFAILNQVNDDEPVEVIRDANTTQIPRRDVVVGDIVLINTGEEIPADGELIEATLLHVDESTLTGEPICTKTTIESEFDADATFPSNHVMKGTKVMEGHGIMRVLAIGDHTEQGKVFEAVQIDNSVKTPLDEQLDGLGRLVAKLSYCVGAGIIIGRILMYFLSPSYEQFEWLPFIAYMLKTLMIAVTLVVVSVPEGLPMAVTLSLAYSMRRMLKTNNLVRKMHACETMGATTVICTDKTGTLTQNQMRVDSLQLYGLDEKSSAVSEAMALNSTAQLDLTDPSHPTVLGNPTEGALLLWLCQHGVDYRELRDCSNIVDQLPFSTERKYMATVVDSALMLGRRILYVKGAPEIVFGMCRTMGEGATRERVEKQLLDYQNHAMRTLGFAFQILEDGDTAISNGHVTANRLHFIGITAIADPVRSDVPAAIKECIDAGISIKIVTGDTPGTAREIGRQVGLWTDKDTDRNIITGPEFAALSDNQLLDRVLDLKIIARARPMDKKRLVEALQKLNQVVAVTGDGTNDAPALRAAQVGLSMGDGTSVAKEASDITIINNSFSSIGKAVMWGRSLYQNIQRFLLFQLTVNVTACLIVLIGAFIGTESPLTVTQMLWINLIMDTFAAMALASLPPSESVMHDRPRDRHAFILTRPMYGEILGVGGLFFVLLFFFLLVFKHADISSLSDMLTLNYLQIFAGFGTLAFWTEGHLTAYELTLLFTIFVMTHFFYLFNARAFETGRSALHFGGCKGLLTIVVIIFVGQVLMVETPILQNFFNVVSLSLQDWIAIIIGSSLVLWVREAWHLATARQLK